MKHDSAPWMRDAVTREGVTRIVADAVEKLRDLNFDTIAFRGMSGALIAPIIAHQLGKEIAMIRKEGVTTHSVCSYEGYKEVKRYVIVDDFVSTGDTIAKIMEAMRRHNGSGIKLAAVYTYYGIWSSKAGLHIPGVSESTIIFDYPPVKEELKKECSLDQELMDLL